MRAFIRTNKNIFASLNFHVAYDGFNQMGWEIIPFENYREIKINPEEDIVIDYIDQMIDLFYMYGKGKPERIDYPEELKEFFGRKIWKSDLNYIASNPETWNIFIKPLKPKKFVGRVIRNVSSFRGCGDPTNETEIWCSEPVKFIAEWRCFIRYGNILDVRRYKGDWRIKHNYKIIENAVSGFTSAPAGYAIDFGVTEDNKTLIVEVNDGFSMGSYGLFSIDYAKLISARWAELMGVEDLCNF